MRNFFALMIIFIVILFFSYSGIVFSQEISDTPLISSMETPAANLMFIIDNSTSMNWEVMMDGHSDGLFHSDLDPLGLIDYGYIFGKDDVFDWQRYSTISGLTKRYWKTQCSAFNKIYYNPRFDYLPWPSTSSYNMEEADMFEPKLFQFGDSSQTFKEMFDQAETINLRDSYVSILNGRQSFAVEDGDLEVDYSKTSGESDWKTETDIFSENAQYHWTNKGGAQAVLPIDVPSSGKYAIIVRWPIAIGDSSGDAVFEIRTGTPDSEPVKTVIKNQNGNAGGALGADAGTGKKNGNLGVININESQYRADEPEIFVTIKMPEDTSQDYIIKIDKAEAIYEYNEEDSFLDLTTIRANINNAHYYTWNDKNKNFEKEPDEELYLVNFIFTDDGSQDQSVSRQYFRVEDKDSMFEGNILPDYVDNGELILVDSLPHHAKKFKYNDENGNPVYMTAEEDLQNFANWFQFYRTRLLVAKSAIARTIYDISGVTAGFYTINPAVRDAGIGIKTNTTGTYIVDDKDSGSFRTYGEGWTTSRADTAYNDRSMVTNDSDKGEKEYAQWDINGIKDADDYDIFIRWSKYNGPGSFIVGRDSAAEYKVFKVDENGTEHFIKSVVVNQETGDIQGSEDKFYPNVWNKITEVNAGEGEKVRIKLLRGDNSSFKYTSADAVKAVSQNIQSNTDNTDELLDLLYTITASGGTPIRIALKTVGEFFDNTPDNETELGQSPYKDASKGGECQQTFSIILTDGYWNGNDSINVGDQDNDGYEDTLADVAANYYFESSIGNDGDDLAPDLDNLVPASDCDKSNTQHMVTYGISFGVKGDIDPDLYNHCNLADNNSISWPDPSENNPAKTDDLFHASINGHGKYFSASNPAALETALGKIISDVENRLKSGASVTLNSHKVKQGMKMYRASYDTTGWSGKIEEIALDNKGEPLEEASKEFFIGDSRFIVTTKQSDTSLSGMVFNYSNIIEDPKASRLDSGINSSQSDEQAKSAENIKNIINYIRGESGSETFRARNSLLGDIVHSSPVLDDDTLYIGANDGMLHAFDLNTYKERFGFIPSFVYNNLNNYTRN
ncbi:MAG: PQQ-binding-like beta-propeller repeat protein, partial [Thermodesulfobacteriota bacterium]